jgi:hypothetical protein
MDIKTYFSAKRKMTHYCNLGCENCQLSILNNKMHVACEKLEQDYPETAEEIMQNYIEKSEGYIICAGTLEKQLVSRCNKFESCTECRNSKEND